MENIGIDIKDSDLNKKIRNMKIIEPKTFQQIENNS